MVFCHCANVALIRVTADLADLSGIRRQEGLVAVKTQARHESNNKWIFF